MATFTGRLLWPLVHEQLEIYGTSGAGNATDEITTAIRAPVAVSSDRVGFDALFRNLSSLWRPATNDGHGHTGRRVNC